jgi:hypothetical protein
MFFVVSLFWWLVLLWRFGRWFLVILDVAEVIEVMMTYIAGLPRFGPRINYRKDGLEDGGKSD